VPIDYDFHDRRQARRAHDNFLIDHRRDAAPSTPPATGVGVLDRSVQILDVVEHGARNLGDIMEATGLTKSTAHRLVRSLERHGFLFYVGGRGYALGPRLLRLAATAMRELPLRQLARPFLEQLARTTGESAQLYVREGDRRVCVDAVEGANELRTFVPVGATLPLTKGSAGKVFLAWGPPPGDPATEDPAFGYPVFGYPATDESTIDDLSPALHTTRRRGWADSYGERQEGVASVSAPVFGPEGHLLAAVSVSGPQARLGGMQARRYAPAVQEAARQIEAALGG
jgi:DNA-binding IclR family transcriptional regulator